MPSSRRCLLYSRHSNPAQSAGDSQSRQLRRALEWIETHGHYLDKTLTFQDKAVSAKAGDPVKKGQLGQLLKLCKLAKYLQTLRATKLF